MKTRTDKNERNFDAILRFVGSMEQLKGLLCVTLLFLVPICLAQKPKAKKNVTPPAKHLTSRQIADKVAKSLVVVFTQDIDGKPLAQGSGFFFGIPKSLYDRKTGDLLTDGDRIFDYKIAKPPLSANERGNLVVSNLHVFKRAWTGKIKLTGSETTYLIKRVVGIDIKHDLCVFEVEGLSAPPLMLADPDKLGIGDDIYVGGSPRGLENTFSKGIISGIRASEGFLQIDAAISSGSSGGPVVDTSGNVVGVATASLVSGQNLNFAVAGSYLMKQRLSWNTSIKETGAFSISDAENDGLVGKVKLVKVNVAEKEDIETDLYSISPRPYESSLYNEDGNNLQVITFDSEGKYQFYSIFKTEYDLRGIRSRITVLVQDRMPTERSYTDTQNLDIKLTQRYYDISKEYEYKAKNGLIVKETSTYDRNGNLIEEMRRASDGSYSCILFEYDEPNRCITERDFREGKLFTTTKYQYKVDAHGNWISQTAIIDLGGSIDPFPNKLVLREISYY
ncbi:MAG: serine protease [Pyrinomonadaceae bacterium]